MGKERIRRSADEKKLTGLRISMILGYTGLIIAIIAVISALVLNKTDKILKDKVSSMTSALNVQMKMNLDSYLDRLESTCTLVFAVDEVYSYSAAEDQDSFDAIATENIISDELYSLCIMENFVDFGIVYSNDHTVGKISNGTIDLFGDKLYSDLCAMINRQKTSDGWAAGYDGNFKRIYYVKRINDTAVLETSFYTSELKKVFEHPGGIDDISVRLVDNNGVIIYSSEDNETGYALPDDIKSRIEAQASATIMDEDYLVTANTCGDGWKVICSVPTKIILKEKNEVKGYIMLVASAASLLAFLTSILLSGRISDPVNAMVTTLSRKASTDQLTQLFNKKTFEDLVTDILNDSDKDDRYALILIDIDNFKGLNDTYGHASGDKALAEVGNILRRQSRGGGAYPGRLGGDEFCLFVEIPKKQADDVEFVENKCRRMCEVFRASYPEGSGKYNIPVSIGAARAPQHGRTFQELYTKADTALYRSKKGGKDSYSMYGN